MSEDELLSQLSLLDQSFSLVEAASNNASPDIPTNEFMTTDIEDDFPTSEIVYPIPHFQNTANENRSFTDTISDSSLRYSIGPFTPSKRRDGVVRSRSIFGGQNSFDASTQTHHILGGRLVPPRRIVLVRHGTSAQNAMLDLQIENNIKALQEVSDQQLSLIPRGVFEAEATGLFLAETAPFDVVFHSPYTRAIQTSDVILAQLPYSPEIRCDVRIREKEFGRLFGYTREQIEAEYPVEYKQRNRDGKYYFRNIGGENYPDVLMRVISFFKDLCEEYSNKSVLIVTHQVPFKLFRAYLEKLTPSETVDLPYVPNCSLQEWCLDEASGNLLMTVFSELAYDFAELEMTPVAFNYAI
ncbi:hypothetical protein PCE1_001223 [Barthelona sp. PCE]